MASTDSIHLRVYNTK